MSSELSILFILLAFISSLFEHRFVNRTLQNKLLLLVFAHFLIGRKSKRNTDKIKTERVPLSNEARTYARKS